MEHILIYAVLVVTGLCMGSFAGATVWRLRARQLVQDKAAGEKISAKEYKVLLPLTKTSITTDRSRCLHCGHTLAWYDMVPLVSWAVTRGKCRYCHERIGWFEPLVELGVATFFVLSYALWPEMLNTSVHIAHFILWLVSGVLLAMLFAYDIKWYLLPNYIVFPLIAVSALVAILNLSTSLDMGMSVINLLVSTIILSGLYLILWLVSKGQWIGFGDVKLGLALALLLGDWQLAFIALFAANLIGCVIVIPGMIAGKITRKTRVPFGPLLIMGAILSALVGQYILGWYFMTLV